MGTTTVESGRMTAVDAAMISCHSCSLLCRTATEETGVWTVCPRCGAKLHSRKPNSLSRTWALVTAALILYLPANLLPIMLTSSMGKTNADTILSGVIYFMKTGDWHLALIILVASVLVPLLKLVVLSYLLLSVQFKWTWRPVDRTRLYRFTEAIGRWSMVDIFAVTTMVALVKMDAFGTVEAGPAAPFFGAVVVITMLAANSFDPRLIWDAVEEVK
ncbi:MAG: paraquat-inducible protein A [Desulfobacteraceae bacterium]